MKKDIFIVDFHDSFTYNVFSILKEIDTNFNIQIIDYKSAHSFFTELISRGERAVILLGPGPGRPEDYIEELGLLDFILKDERFFLFGLCLGHQIIWSILNGEVSRRLKPTHGQSVTYSLNELERVAFSLEEKSITVQNYNSLCVEKDSCVIRLNEEGLELFFDSNELIMSRSKLFFSCQFHPESVATINSKQFFNSILEFLGSRV